MRSLNRIVKDIGDEINIDMKPKFLGRNLIMIISAKNTYGKDKNKNKEVSN